MAARGTPLAELVVSDDEREILERWARRPTTAQALALRCRIVLACAEGLSNVEVADRLGVNRMTVGKWRSRFVSDRLDGLHDEPRPGGPRSIGDDDVERVIVKTLEETPRDATHWSTRSMAQAAGMSQSAVSRIWRAFGLKPHLVDSFKLSPDPLFIDKVRDIVGLYLNPPEAAVVLCVDEKSQIQALDRTAPVLPLIPGTPERRTHDYRRQWHHQPLRRLGCRFGPRDRRHDATASRRGVPAVLEPDRPQRSRRLGRPRHRRQQRHPQDPSDPAMAAAPSPVHAPLHADLQLMAEPRRALVRRAHQPWLRRGTHRSTRELVASIRTWITNWNDEPKPFVWHKTADEILDNLANYCQRISDSGH